jgi:hypothetical protein
MVTRADLLKKFNGNPPASREAVSEFAIATGLKVPTDYRDFLMKNNGGEGFIGDDSYLMLWRVEDLQQFNKEYEVEEYLDNVLLIGSSGGGDAYGFDIGKKPWPIIRVPFVGMEPRLVESVAPTFSEFLEVLNASSMSS